MPIASVATIILHVSFGSLKRWACNNFVPDQNLNFIIKQNSQINLPGGNDP
jgi:hypothetical protein